MPPSTQFGQAAPKSQISEVGFDTPPLEGNCREYFDPFPITSEEDFNTRLALRLKTLQ